jgi:hypothetical protein
VSSAFRSHRDHPIHPAASAFLAMSTVATHGGSSNQPPSPAE